MDLYKDGLSIKSHLITQLTLQNLVLQSRGNIYKLIAQYKDGSLNLDEPLKKKELPKLLSAVDLNGISTDIETYNGKSVGEEKIITLIVENKK